MVTTDFRIDCTNNLAERELRKVKKKFKIAGGYRNLNFAKYYCHAITIIDTCKKTELYMKKLNIKFYKEKLNGINN